MTSTVHPAPAHPPTAPGRAGPARRLLRGRPDEAAWARPGLFALLAATAVLYIWGLGASGWANSFYSAAAQAASRSWSALFFGSLDAANAITVDKTPGALWIMDLSVRLFGLNSWSILVPEALMGVGTVALLYATVRRVSGPAAGLLAGAALALTPVAVLMFRFNNPDALLVLLLTGGAYATLRAVERTRGGGAAGTWWLVLAGTCVGFGFLAKMLQAFLVLPVFALVYLLAADTPVRRRILALLAGGAALIVSAGWWVAIVQLVPASARPYIGGSQHNSVLELAFGYNGFGRLTGDETGGLGNTNQDAGLLRMFGSELGGQVSWLLPAAAILLVTLLALAWRSAGGWRSFRTDGRVVATALWGGWLVLTAGVFSVMSGIFHPYYTVALAPPIAALFGMGIARLWSLRTTRAAAWTLAVTLAVTAAWSYVLLARTSTWMPWLRWLLLAAGLLAATALAVSLLLTTRKPAYPQAEPAAPAVPAVPSAPDGSAGPGRPAGSGGPATSAESAGPAASPLVRVLRRAAPVALVVAVITALAGPAAYAVQTAATPHTGAIPSAGPSGAGMPGMGFAGGHRMGGPGHGAAPGSGHSFTRRGPGQGGFPGQNPSGQNRPGSGTFPGGTRHGTGGSPGGGPRMGGMGGMGGLLGSVTPSTAVTKLLTANAGSYTWVAATEGANNAAGYQLATRSPVLALGGFNGTDPSPTLAQFQAYVAQHRIHYFIGGATMGGGPGGPGGRTGSSGSQEAQRIAKWVQQHYKAQKSGTTTLYDLTKPRS